MENQSALIAFINRPSKLAEIQDVAQAFKQEGILQFIQATQQMHTLSEINEALSSLGPLFVQGDNFHVAMLALLCGSMVESGGDPTILVDTIVGSLVNQLQQLKDSLPIDKSLSPEEMFLRFPDALRVQSALSLTIPSAMTMLCRDKEARKRWHQRQDVIILIDNLDELGEIPFFLKRTVHLLDDKDLLVLDPSNKRGYLTRLIGVQDVMYHCYALLQHAILEHTGPGYLDAEPTDKEAVQYARNDNLVEQDYHNAQGRVDYQRFGFSYPGGLFFAGSASFYDLPVYDGLPLLLIEKKFMNFRWEPANMYPVLHEALRSEVEIVRELSHEEVDTWLQRCVH